MILVHDTTDLYALEMQNFNIIPWKITFQPMAEMLFSKEL